MDKNKSRVIIIEGAQGAGKTTATTYLREHIPYSNLYRLTGIADKSENGRVKIFNHYLGLMEYLGREVELGATHIFDRTFMTEMIYATMDHAHYDFTAEYNHLVTLLSTINKKAPVYYVTLTSSKETFEKRLMRGDKPQHAGVIFGAEESLSQQEVYLGLHKNLPLNNLLILQTDDMTPEEVGKAIINFIEEREAV